MPVIDFSNPPPPSPPPDWASTHKSIVGIGGVIALLAFLFVYNNGLANHPRRLRLFGALIVTGLVAVSVLAMLGAGATAMVLAGGVATVVSLSIPFIAIPQHDERPAEKTAPDDVAPVQATSSQVLEALERLAVLRDRGALTDHEFDEQKAKFLA